ncbi:MAG: transporter substrate-binding domain-containing protein [Lachnospiraceae bacterium]
MKKTLKTLLALTLFITIASGCSSPATTAETAKSPETVTAEQHTSAAEVTDSSADTAQEDGPAIQAIKEKGYISVATGTYVPFEYRDDNNNIVGFDIDFAQYIADKLGVELRVNDMEFQAIVPSIQNGEYDFSIAAMYKTEARCEVVDMSKSYCDSGMILAVKDGSELESSVKTLSDCAGLKIAVKEGATSYHEAQAFLDSHTDISYEIVQYKDTVGCVSDLLVGRVDVVVNDLLNQKELSKVYSGTVIVGEPFTQAENAIAVQKGKEDLLAFINQCIDDYYADGTYQQLWDKWIEGQNE